MSIVDLLERTAQRIERNGVHKGGFRNPTTGALCMMATLGVEFAESEHKVSEVIPAIRWAAGLGVQAGGRKFAADIIKWADAPERSVQDVVHCLRNAKGYAHAG